MLRSIIEKLKNFRQYMAYGGITHVTVNQVSYNLALKEKKILITGGGTGIGYSIAKKAVNEGATVVITGRHIDKLNSAINELDSNNIFPLQMDISKPSEMREKINDAEKLLGGSIDILVNNAGTYAKTHFPNVSEDNWNRVYDTNSKGTFFLIQEMCGRWRNTPPVTHLSERLSTSLPKGHLLMLTTHTE